MLNSVDSCDSSFPDEKLGQQSNLICLRPFTLISPMAGNLKSHNTLSGTRYYYTFKRESININLSMYAFDKLHREVHVIESYHVSNIYGPILCTYPQVIMIWSSMRAHGTQRHHISNIYEPIFYTYPQVTMIWSFMRAHGTQRHHNFSGIVAIVRDNMNERGKKQHSATWSEPVCIHWRNSNVGDEQDFQSIYLHSELEKRTANIVKHQG